MIAASVRQGYYRAHVWTLTTEGTPVAATPTTSGTFTVFPSANNQTWKSARRRNMSRGLLASMMAAALVVSCGEDVTGPLAELCATRHGAEVCANRAEYQRTQPVTFTTRNVSSRPIFKDACSTKLVGVTSLSREFEEEYNPRLRCGSGATAADVRANMVRLESGESFEESLTLPTFAFQGYYRANVWILDEQGERVAETPAFSGIFRVFPSTGG